MKNLKMIILIMTLAVLGTSCESYDDFETHTIVGFTRANYNINGIGSNQGDRKTAEVTVFVSDMASVDRTFTITDIEIDNPDDFPPTDRENFEYQETVTIPAGEYNGTLLVTGINNTLNSDPDPTFFRLAVLGTPEVVVGSSITIRLRP